MEQPAAKHGYVSWLKNIHGVDMVNSVILIVLVGHQRVRKISLHCGMF